MGIMAKLSAPNKTLLHQALSWSIKSSLVRVEPHTAVRIHVQGEGKGGL